MKTKYYELVKELIQSHKKYAGLEPILEDIINDVFAHSEVVISNISNEVVVQAYLEKVVATSVITVPKKLNFKPVIQSYSQLTAADILKRTVDNKLVDKMINLSFENNKTAVIDLEKEDLDVLEVEEPIGEIAPEVEEPILEIEETIDEVLEPIDEIAPAVEEEPILEIEETIDEVLEPIGEIAPEVEEPILEIEESIDEVLEPIDEIAPEVEEPILEIEESIDEVLEPIDEIAPEVEEPILEVEETIDEVLEPIGEFAPIEDFILEENEPILNEIEPNNFVENLENSEMFSLQDVNELGSLEESDEPFALQMSGPIENIEIYETVQAKETDLTENDDENKNTESSVFLTLSTFDNSIKDFDMNLFIKELTELNRRHPELHVVKIYELKYKDNYSVTQIAEELEIHEDVVIDALSEIISLI